MVCNYYKKNSKLNLCTSHGFNYNFLEEQIIKMIKNEFMNLNINKLEKNIERYKIYFHKTKLLKDNLNNKIEELTDEIKSLQNNIDKMYIDKLNGKITDEMYNRIDEKLNHEIKIKNQQLKDLNLNTNDNITNQDKPIPDVINEFLDLKEINREIILKIIKRIEIHQDKMVDLYYNFKYITY